jgi:NitT/TauT family transport system substrate-binding protein
MTIRPNSTWEEIFLKHKIQALTTLLLTLALVLALPLAGCGSNNNSNGNTNGQATNDVALPTKEIVIATMVTEDILPFWVAQSEELFATHGLNARVETFQSAQELSTAVTSGTVQLAMTDPMVAASLAAGGTDVTLEWVTLGENAKQGRFGIMTSPNSGVTTLQDLAGKPIGVGSNTILEYVMDKLMEQAGIANDQIVSEEIKKIPARYEAMTSNQVAAAALPGSLLALGQKTGMVLVADDTEGENLSQSIMIARADFADTPEGAAAIEVLREVWDQAASEINANPDSYRTLLIEKASLPDAIANDYPVSTYPLAKLPTAVMIDPILEWMQQKDYLTVALSYDPATGAFVKQ